MNGHEVGTVEVKNKATGYNADPPAARTLVRAGTNRVFTMFRAKLCDIYDKKPSQFLVLSRCNAVVRQRVFITLDKILQLYPGQAGERLLGC